MQHGAPVKCLICLKQCMFTVTICGQLGGKMVHKISNTIHHSDIPDETHVCFMKQVITN